MSATIAPPDAVQLQQISHRFGNLKEMTRGYDRGGGDLLAAPVLLTGKRFSMWTWFCVVVILLFAIGALREWLLNRKYHRLWLEHSVQGANEPLMIDPTPDSPTGFGYKIGWIAVRTEDADAVTKSIPMSNVRVANWATGVESAYAGEAFITPPMDGWVLVVSTNAMAIEHFVWQQLLADLSIQFKEAQGFGSFRIVDAYAWSKYQNGKEIRTYACSDWTSVIRGTLTPEEREYGKRFFDYSSPEAENEGYFEREDLMHPDEEDVLEIAKRWGFDPRELDSDKWPRSAGWIGDLDKEYQLQTLARG